jgi:hypothetical protein
MLLVILCFVLAVRIFLGAHILVGHYTTAFHLAPEDPLINLSLGIAYLHWAMQRKTDNRHLRVMQVSSSWLALHWFAHSKTA